MWKRRLNYKDKVSFKIFDITAWLANNYNTYIAQYLTKYRQADIEIWSSNRISQQKYFSSKIMEKMRHQN